MPNNEGYNRLVESVRKSSPDRRIAEDPRDWAFEVEEAIYEGEEKLKKTAYLFRDYIPDFDSYLAQKLTAYRAEIDRIEMEFDQKEVQTSDIDRMIEDILNDFEDTYAVDAAETDFIRMAEEEPDVLLANAEAILNREDAKILLSKAAKKDPASAIKYAAEYADKYGYVLDDAIVADPASFEKYYPGFKDSINYDLSSVLYQSESIFENPDAVCYFRVLAEYSPSEIFFYDGFFDEFLKAPYAVEVLKSINLQKLDYLDDKACEDIVRMAGKEEFFTVILHLNKNFFFSKYLFDHLADVKKYSPYSYEYLLVDIFYEDIRSGFENLEKNASDTVYRRKLLETVKSKFKIYYPHNADLFQSIVYDLISLEDKTFTNEVFENIASGYSIPVFLGFKSMLGVAEDPALRQILNIDRSWIPNLNIRQFANYAQWICRNLYFQNKELNEDNVKNEYSRILEKRKELKNVRLFTNRNIVLASHGENWGPKDNYQDRFGNYSLQSSLKIQQAGDGEFQHFEPKRDSFEEVKKAKEESLKAIIETQPPMTFIFDGHGSKDAFYFSDGQLIDDATKQPVVETEKTVKVTVDEFADALLKRASKFGGQSLAKDIFIFTQCYNHNFIRKVNEVLRSKGVSCPIMIGESEYNVSSLSDMQSKYENNFYDEVLKLDQLSTTFEDLFNSANHDFNNYADSNFTIYIPDEKGLPMQVAKNETGERSSAA